MPSPSRSATPTTIAGLLLLDSAAREPGVRGSTRPVLAKLLRLTPGSGVKPMPGGARLRRAERISREAACLTSLLLLLSMAALEGLLCTEADTCTGSEARRPWLRPAAGRDSAETVAGSELREMCEGEVDDFFLRP